MVSLTEKEDCCSRCHGAGYYPEETAPGEYRNTVCGACLGKGTKWSAQLHAEYVRGWNAALAEVHKLTEARSR